MSEPEVAEFELVADVELESPVLIEGLPGHGLVASIAVDHLTRQLDLAHHGNITDDSFPPAVTFRDGLVRDLVRVYAGTDADVLTLQSDLPLPQAAFRPLGRCVLEEFAADIENAVFLAGAPAESEQQVGDVRGIATTADVREELVDAGVEPGAEPGLIGGVTGALVRECYHSDVPAAVLIVRAHPFLPDPLAARAVIEDALEPLVDFDIDTTELAAQADEIKGQMEQIAQQYRQMTEEQQTQEPSVSRMYQ
jgi:uncharacterized protein